MLTTDHAGDVPPTDYAACSDAVASTTGFLNNNGRRADVHNFQAVTVKNTVDPVGNALKNVAHGSSWLVMCEWFLIYDISQSKFIYFRPCAPM